MICQACRNAADHLSEQLLILGRAPEHVITWPAVESAHAVARQGHSECAGERSCDCQHKVERHGLVSRG